MSADNIFAYAAAFIWLVITINQILEIVKSYRKPKPAPILTPVMTEIESDDAWIDALMFNRVPIGYINGQALIRLKQRGLVDVTITFTDSGREYFANRNFHAH